MINSSIGKLNSNSSPGVMQRLLKKIKTQGRYSTGAYRDGPARKARNSSSKCVGKCSHFNANRDRTSEKGVYNVRTGIVKLQENVRITRGKTQLNGNEAEVNLNTGISRLIGGKGRVRGLIHPNNQTR